jgi:hypothetical protein
MSAAIPDDIAVPLKVTNITISPSPPINATKRSVTVTVDFNESMNTSVQPNVTTGLAPDHENVTFAGTWQNSTQWQGTATIPIRIYDGMHRIKVANAKNASGDTIATNYSSQFMVDTEPPKATAEALPRFMLTKSFKMNAGTMDNTSGIAAVELWYKHNQTSWVNNATDNKTPFEWNFVAQDEGLYEFATRAIDKAGNWEAIPTSNESWTVVDTLPPVSKAGPVAKSVKGWNVTINASASDADGVSIVELWFSMDGGQWSIYGTDSSSPWQWDFNASTMGSGTYELSTRAHDHATLYENQHEKNDTWVSFDLGLPDTKVNRPPSQYVNSRSVKLTIAANSEPWMIDHTEVWYNESSGWNLVGTTYDRTFTFNASTDGAYEFYSIGVSLTGARESAPQKNDTWLIVDTVRPSIVVSPKNGSSGVGLMAQILINFSEPVFLYPQNDITISPLVNHTVYQDPTHVVITPDATLSTNTKYTISVKGHDIAGNAFSYNWWFATKPSSPPRVSSTYPRQNQNVYSFGALYLNFTDKMNRTSTTQSVKIVSGAGASLKDPIWTSERALVFKVESASVGFYEIVIEATLAINQDGLHLDGNGDGIPGDNYALRFLVAPPPVPFGSILGKVVDMRGNSIANVAITVSRNGTRVANATSGLGGEFEVKDPLEGRYHITASKKMLKDVELDVNVVAGKVAQVKIPMDFKSDVGIEAYIIIAVVAVILAIALSYGLRDQLKDKISFFGKKGKKKEKREKAKEKGPAGSKMPGLKANAIDSRSVHLEWEPVECVGYTLYYSLDGKRFEHVVEVPKKMSSYTHEGAKPGSTVWYRIDVRYTGKATANGGEAKVAMPSKKKD